MPITVSAKLLIFDRTANTTPFIMPISHLILKKKRVLCKIYAK